jgi:sec-independent protein translocase protein TatB
MFEVGFTEIILILGIALLVLGPEKLPKLANQVGRWAGRARAMARQLRQQLDEEVTVINREELTVDAPKAAKHAAPERPNPSPTAPQPPVVDPHAEEPPTAAEQADETPRQS